MNFMSRTFPVLPFKETQGSALRKIKGSPVLVICETLGAQHVICIKKNLRFCGCPKAKVGCQGPPGSARAQPLNSQFLVVLQSSFIVTCNYSS